MGVAEDRSYTVTLKLSKKLLKRLALSNRDAEASQQPREGRSVFFVVINDAHIDRLAMNTTISDL
jgi:hypothetical protein